MEIEWNKYFVGLGDTNAGKSTIVTACQNMFGEYKGTFNGENLSHQKVRTRWSAADEMAIIIKIWMKYI